MRSLGRASSLALLASTLVVITASVGIGVRATSDGDASAPDPTPTAEATPDPTSDPDPTPEPTSPPTPEPTPPPASDRIAFTRDGVIYTIEPGGGDERALREGSNPMWSPDRSRIIFDHPGPSGTRDIWVMGADGSGAEPLLSRSVDDSSPSWSPDGTRVTFATRSDRSSPDTGDLFDVAVLQADGSVSVLLRAEPGPPDDPVGYTSYTGPRWSPQGSLIGLMVESGRRAGPAVVQPDGSGLRQVYGGVWSHELHLSWSPDAASIVFSTGGAPCEGLFIVAVDSQQESCIAGAEDFNEAAWSPDGQRLVASRTFPSSELWIMNTDGSGQRRLASGERPSW